MEIIVFRQGSELAGRYVLERRLGAGGMATVWLARDERLQRPVAIKLPTDALLADATFARRFEREAQTAAALSHPNLVSVYDYGLEGERPYLVSEFIEGASLAQLRDQGRAPASEPVARALLEALAHIHKAGIVHRDVKPANVLVEGEDRILLTDFGIAQSTEETRLTATGNVIGTYDYIPPEVRRGERAGPPADLFACGVLLREQLNEADSGRLHYLVGALTAAEPADRPAGAEDALAILDGADDAQTATMPVEEATAPAPVPAPPLPPRPRRQPEAVIADRPKRAASGEQTTSGGGRPVRNVAIGLLAAGLIAIAGIAIASAGDDDGGSGGNVANVANREQSANATEPTTPEIAASSDAAETTDTAETTDPAETRETTTDAAEAAPVATEDPAAGIALNNEGFALLQAGDYEAALPKLEQAVASFPEDSTDINYAYTLFNYAQALRFTGDPASAIPYLEKRLAISNYKRGVVQNELATAQEEAGVSE